MAPCASEPAATSRSIAGERGDVTTIVARERNRVETGGEHLDPVALVEVDRWPELDGHAAVLRRVESKLLVQPLGFGVHVGLAARVLAPVQREAHALLAFDQKAR